MTNIEEKVFYVPVSKEQHDLIVLGNQPLNVETVVSEHEQKARQYAYHAYGSESRVLRVSRDSFDEIGLKPTEMPFISVYSGEIKSGDVGKVYSAQQPPIKYKR